MDKEIERILKKLDGKDADRVREYILQKEEEVKRLQQNLNALGMLIQDFMEAHSAYSKNVMRIFAPVLRPRGGEQR